MEAVELTQFIVDNKSNVKPSYFHTNPVWKSIKHQRKVVTDSSREVGSTSWPCHPVQYA